MFARLGLTLQRLPGWWRLRSYLLPYLARLQRKRLRHVRFIGITGSAGKTSAKILATAVLATAGKIRPWLGTMNDFQHIMRVVVATKPSDDFCVIEFSAAGPGSLDRSLQTVKPEIGAVISIGTDHLKAYHSIEAIAAEKGKLIACLPPEGVAVLNADDPRVAAMASRFAGRILTFGLSDHADLRATCVHSAWPSRLTFTAHYKDQHVDIRSQLCGTHWTPAVLAALAIGIAAKVPLQQAAKAIASVEPYPSRMFPITSAEGVTFVVDDWKSSLSTVSTILEFLRGARAPRKVAVFGTLSDYGGNAGATYARTALAALEVSDYVVFVGPMATLALRARNTTNAARLHAFNVIKDAAHFLASILQADDLVVLKGSVNADHLGRLAHHWVEPISCWSMSCRKNMPCSACEELRHDHKGKAPKLSLRDVKPTESPRAPERLREWPRLTPPFEVIVGIGNPGQRYQNTPHNVGFAVADDLAEKLAVNWEVGDDVMLAWAKRGDTTLLLVKPQAYVNNVGKVLKKLAGAVSFSAEDCILVQDDVHLPFGGLRSRMRGSDGGHNGVSSVLVAFQTSEFRRVKIGVAPAVRPSAFAEYLVAPLSTEEQAKLSPVIVAASERVMAMVRGRTARSPQHPMEPEATSEAGKKTKRKTKRPN